MLLHAQTTIVNWNFDAVENVDYTNYYPRAANGIYATLSSNYTWNTSNHTTNGTVTGGSAFTNNSVSSPNRNMGISTGNYLNVNLTGAALSAYSSFKFYFQAGRSGSGTATMTITYSVDGGSFTSFTGNTASVSSTPPSYNECLFTLPSISPKATLDLRITTSGGTTISFDNIQVQAVETNTNTATVGAYHPIAGNIFQNTTTNLIAGYKMDAHAGTVTPSQIILTTAGTYSVGEVTNFKLWQNTENSLTGATQVGSTLVPGTSPATLTFTGGFNSISAGTTAYFLLTADVSNTITAGHTINITTTILGNLSFSTSTTAAGTAPMVAGTTQTIAANAGNATSNVNKYSKGGVTWDNGTTQTKWSNTSNGSYNLKWVPNSIANLETSAATVAVDNATGAVVQQINSTITDYIITGNVTSNTTYGPALSYPATVNVSTGKLTIAGASGSTTITDVIFGNYGLTKNGAGELRIQNHVGYRGVAFNGPFYVNAGTLTIGDKTTTSTSVNPNLWLKDNPIYLNDATFTIAAPSSTNASLGRIPFITVNSTGSARLEIYNTAATAAAIYAELTVDDRFPQKADDMVPLNIKGTLTIGYGNNTSKTTGGVTFGTTTFNGNSTFTLQTNGAGNVVANTGITSNIELAGEGNITGAQQSGAPVGSYTMDDNGYSMTINGGGSSADDGGYVSINGNGTNTGAWTVGDVGGTTEAGYLIINDPDGLTSGSVTVNTNSQMRINASTAPLTIPNSPTITLNGQKTKSYYGALALYNSAAGNTTLGSPIVVNTSDATVGIYNDNWFLTGAITGTGGFSLYGNASTYDLTISSGSNTWSGGTKVLSGILNVSSGSSISTGGLTMAQLTGFNTALNLNNASQTVSSLSTSWSNTTGTFSQTITLASGHVLTVNQSTNTTYGNGAVTTLTGIIAGAGNLVKDGSGILTLTGANTYTGITQVKGGTLKFNNSAASTLPATNDVHIIGGTLDVAVNQTLNNVILSTGTLTVETGITLTINGTLTIVNGSISLVGTGKIVYGASGTVTYAGSNAQTTTTSEIPTTSGPKGIVIDNNTSSGVTLSADVANLSGTSTVNGWLDFNGKKLTGTGTFTLNGATGPYTVTGNTSTSSTTITNISSTTNLKMGMYITGTGLAANTYIIYINPLVANTIDVNTAPTSNVTGTSITALWRGGLKVSMTAGIGDGSTNCHVQLSGTKTYNSGANYVFNTPTSGTQIYPAMPTTGTLNYSPAYNVTIQAGVVSSVPNKVILGASSSLEISNDLTLTTGIFVTNSNLITWDNTGTLTFPGPVAAGGNGSGNFYDSYIATSDNSGTPLSVAGPTTPLSANYGFKIKNIGFGGRTGNTFFPVGATYLTAGTGYTIPTPNRVMINNDAGTAPSDFNIVVTYGDIGNTPNGIVHRIWYINASDTAAAHHKANLRLYFVTRNNGSGNFPSAENEIEGAPYNTFNYTQSMVVERDYQSSNTNFVAIASGSDIISNSATPYGTEVYAQYTTASTANGITQFNRFSVTNPGGIILPVTIVDLTAAQKGENVNVDWTSVDETNIDHYEIDRSTDGIHFTTIGSITALNNGQSRINYSFTDKQPNAGNNYYQVRAVDISAKDIYSNIARVFVSTNKAGISVYPNPVKTSKVNVQFTNMQAGNYNVILYSNTGQKILQKNIQYIGGNISYDMLLPVVLPKGSYHLVIASDNMKTDRIIIIE